MNKRPNILLITSDQHRADSLGCYGHTCVQTPHLDQLAYEGIKFENAYTDCPVCIPARTTMITGIQSHSYGSPSYNENFRIDRERNKFLGSLVTSSGYQTQLVGKTHWHTEPDFRGGFENVAWFARLRRERLIKTGRSGTLEGMGFNEVHPTISELPKELYGTNWVVDQCFDFLDCREKGQPFFLWASFIDPHPPLVIHEPYYSMYDNYDIPEPVMPEWVDSDKYPYSLYMHRWSWNSGQIRDKHLKKTRSVYYGMITNLDHQLGRLFSKLMYDGDWDNTIVIYTSDHGEHLGDFGDLGKSCFLESAARIPFIVRIPGWMNPEPGRTSDALIELADLLPTICDYAGAEIPDDVEGKSLKKIIDGSGDKVRDYMHGQIESQHMFHDGTYKYLYFADDGKELLFDTSKDRRDCCPIEGDVLEKMRKEFLKHLVEENNSHQQNGKLINNCKTKPPVNVVKGMDPSGLQPVAALSDVMRNIIHIH